MIADHSGALEDVGAADDLDLVGAGPEPSVSVFDDQPGERIPGGARDGTIAADRSQPSLDAGLEEPTRRARRPSDRSSVMQLEVPPAGHE